MSKLVSIVVPGYNEQESLPLLVDELVKTIAQCESTYTFELVFVDDGSIDNTLATVKELAQKTYDRLEIRWISFSRNFGKEPALHAGLKAAKGDYVCAIDADLQDPPSLIPEMIAILETGEFDSVATRRVSREGEPPIRSFFARLFYCLINRFSDVKIVDGARDFRMMNRKMVNAVLSITEYNRFSKGIFGWVGFRTKWIEFENVERAAGKTKWSFWGLTRYALDGLTAFSTAPLTSVAVLGFAMSFVGFVALIFIIIRALIFGDPTAGWPSMMCTIVLIGGIVLLCLGVIGEYLSKAYLEIKNRPLYIVAESSDESSREN